jgi:CBS domain-containing protein
MHTTPLRHSATCQHRRFCGTGPANAPFARVFVASERAESGRCLAAAWRDACVVEAWGSQHSLAKIAHKVVRLPIASRALDIHELTQRVDTVMCPARHDIISVGNCRQCRDFRRIEPGNMGPVVVCCGSRESARQFARTVSVQEKVQLPHVCASVESTLASVLPYADTLQPWDAIPILDHQARPVGIIMGAELHRLRADRCDPTQPVERAMSTSFATVFPCMSLADAAQLRGRNSFRGAIVVSEDDTFLGVVSEPDLERACRPATRDTASPP